MLPFPHDTPEFNMLHGTGARADQARIFHSTACFASLQARDFAYYMMSYLHNDCDWAQTSRDR